MNSLYNYINNVKKVDAHIHLFNHKEFIPAQTEYEMYVAFGDVEFDTEETLHKKYYEFMDGIADNIIPLCTGRTIDEIAQIYKKHSDKFKGFGEIKMYSKYQDKEVNYKKISLLRDVCKLSKESGNKPIYFHWDVETIKDVTKIVKVIKDYPSIKFVWCHCGMWDGGDNDFIFNQVRQAAMDCGNLWLDVSYTALNYFADKCLLKITQLPLDRVIVGSDLNMKIFSKKHSPKEIIIIYDKMKQVREFVNSDMNVKKLFGV